jgi:hypothetical protein
MIFESDTPSPEAVQYSSELAKRMDGELVMLRLAGTGIPDVDEPRRIAGTGTGIPDVDEPRRIAGRLAGSGLSTRVEARQGDPRSELLKFMATEPSFMAVVWGGPDDIILDPGKATSHWLAGQGGEIGCPLVTMHRKLREGRATSRKRRPHTRSKTVKKAGR